ncbi:MAG: TetR/AcrR family transcriptional regulator [Bdellovibrionales bacterium]
MSENQQETKEKIIKAAKAVFAEKGFDAASIRDITGHANVNVGAINYHFGSKEDLLKYILNEFSGLFLDATKVLRSPKNFTEFQLRMEMLLRNMVELSMENQDSVLIFFKEQDKIMNRFLEVIMKNFMAARQTIVSFVTESQDRAVINKTVDPDVLTKALIFIVKGEMQECHIMEKLNLPNVYQPGYKEMWIEQNIHLLTSPLKLENEVES